jgi:spermidine/putrescine transport system substrate-binding protein
LTGFVAIHPGNTFSIPWASGSTGIAWNPQYITTPVTSVDDPVESGLQGPRRHDVGYPGHRNFGMIKLGINPETSKPADWRAAAATLTG